MKTQIYEGMHAIPTADFDALDMGGDPFISKAFLGTAEDFGASGLSMGWSASHIGIQEDEKLLGLLPLYLRTHSFGDFSRDWNWPSAWRQARLAYYPKLVSGVPYTPSPGPRLLVRHGADRTAVASQLVAAALHRVQETGASSWQCLFVKDADREVLTQAGLLLRRGVQFHWLNRDYEDFGDFLSAFTAAKRKKIKRERRAVSDSGLRFETRHGDEICVGLWQSIHRHYRNTFERYGNHPAFPVEFFSEMARGLGRQVVVFLAYMHESPVASAICYRDAEKLFGRHWGTDIDIPGLHFELCYYQGIDYCIDNHLDRFEPGAQGEHKLARGFEPVPTWSAYWIADAGMRRAVSDFISREDAAMQDYEAETSARLPFRENHPQS